VYLLVIADSATPIVHYFLPKTVFDSRRVVLIIIAVCFVFPLICLKSVSMLSYTSGIGVFAVFYTCGFVIVRGIDLIVERGLGERINFVINPSSQFLAALPMISFAYQCHIMLPPIFAELKDRSIWKIDLVIIISLSLCVILEGSVAIIGYLTFGYFTLGNILLSFSVENTFAIFSRVGMAMTGTFAYPITNVTARLTTKSLFFSRDEELTDTQFYGITGVWFLMTLLIAIFVPNIQVGFGYTGSFGCVAVMFVFPSLILWVLSNDYHPIFKILCKCYSVLLFFFGMIILVGGCFSSTMNLILGDSWYNTIDFWRK
jgi:solute carrier family 38 (sodium-coupled neutral amino acid transporter), member 11